MNPDPSMLDAPASPTPSPGTPPRAVQFVAWVLIVAGLYLVLLVVSQLWSIWTAPESVRFFLAQEKALADRALFSTAGSESFALGPGGAHILALLFAFIFGALASSLGLGVLRLGVYLLSPRLAQEIERLKLRLESLRQRVINRLS